MNIGEFELIDHGVQHSQYFQGCGATFTDFENITTGIGDNPAEAIDNCLEQMAQDGFDVDNMEARIIEQEGWEALPIEPSVLAEFIPVDEEGKEWDGECEVYYHVSIRWNQGSNEESSAQATD